MSPRMVKLLSYESNSIQFKNVGEKLQQLAVQQENLAETPHETVSKRAGFEQRSARSWLTKSIGLLLMLKIKPPKILLIPQ
jgi:hypothetical protein